MEEIGQPRRVSDGERKKVMWCKEDGNSGPRAGEKAPNQLFVKAEYKGQVMKLHLVDAAQQKYSWQAFKSKVNWM